MLPGRAAASLRDFPVAAAQWPASPATMNQTASPTARLPVTPGSPNPRRVFLLGATGTIGRATLRALLRRGHEVVCFVRPR
eukprot:gene18449-26016_t